MLGFLFVSFLPLWMAAAQVCAPECLNGGICSNGSCACPINYNGTDCSEERCPLPSDIDLTQPEQVIDFLGVRVSCDAINVSVTLNRCELLTLVGDLQVVLTDPDDLELFGDDVTKQCFPALSEEFVEFEAGHRECGSPPVETFSTLDYNYAVLTALNRSAAYSPLGGTNLTDPDFRYHFFLTFQCAIQRRESASLDVVIIPFISATSLTVETSVGNFVITSGFLLNSTTQRPNSSEVVFPEPIRFTFSLTGEFTGNYTVQPTDCWAAPTNDPDSAIRRNITEGGCPSPDQNDVIIEQTSEQITFQFSSFIWPSMPEPQSIFMFCDVDICQNCPQSDCSSSRRGRIATNYAATNQRVSLGSLPIVGGTPCQYNHGGCEQVCTETTDSRVNCSCVTGYELAADNATCSELPVTEPRVATGATTWWIAVIVGAVVLIVASSVTLWWCKSRSHVETTNRVEVAASSEPESNAGNINSAYL